MRLVDADELKKEIQKIDYVDEYDTYDKGFVTGIQRAIEAIDNAPTVIPDKDEFTKAIHQCLADIDEWKKKYERPQGEWSITDETDEFYGRVYKCTHCGKEMLACGCRNFCTWCGASMEVKKNESNN